MLRFFMILFSAVVFALLALQLGIHSDAQRWAEGAVSVFMASFLVDGVGPAVAWPTRRQAPPA